MNITGLRCEYLKDPLGIDTVKPRLSWILVSNQRGQKQSAYHILAASSRELLEQNRGDFWDTGKVVSGQSVHISYAGKKLTSRMRCYWKVKVWDFHGVPSVWSEPALWEMGLLQKSDWVGRWIGADNDVPSTKSMPSPFLRRRFRLKGKVLKGRVYVTAFGLYELFINGSRVGNDLFTPGWTDYAIRLQYQSYDVTKLLRQNNNAIGAILGDGWFNGKIRQNRKGHSPHFLAQLEIGYENDSSDIIATDGLWKCATGPILTSDIYDGEKYDARYEMRGWSNPDFDDSNWKTARIYPSKNIILNASASPCVRRIQELKPIAMFEPAAGVYVFDFGQNMAGWAKLKVTGSSGMLMRLRYAEMLNSDGTIYTANLRKAICTDQYIVYGQGTEIFEPHFTYHGFRYVELTGYPGKPSRSAVTGVVIHSDLTPTGTFICSNTMLNRLQHNIQWGQKSNFFEVPTDCPQRDERLGWTGDAQIFMPTACFNMNVAGFFTKWLVDLSDAQSDAGAFPMVAPDVVANKKGDGGAGWADAGIICPWIIYCYYGDLRILERHYKSMTTYLRFLKTVDWANRHCFGDWLNINDPTPNELIGIAFYAYDATIMANVAAVLGKSEDLRQYRALRKEIKSRFIRKFVSASGRLAGDSQTAYALALHFDLLPTRLLKAAGNHLVRRICESGNNLSTGFLGTPYLLFALMRTGHLDVAYRLLLNEKFPSWGYHVKNGATTMWERWDGWRHDDGFKDPKMNSFNHYAYGAVGEWLYRVISGINVDAAGYKHARLYPFPHKCLTHAEGRYNSVYGEIVSAWRIEKGKFKWDIFLPPGTTAKAFVPAKDIASVTESGNQVDHTEYVKCLGMENDRVVFKIVSGKYRFVSLL